MSTLNPQRTIAELKELRALTGNDNGAQRVAFTKTWLAARDWLRRKVAGLPLEIHNDAAGNTWFTLRGKSEKALLIGGHIDSVPNGGWLDGCLNVLAGVEILRRINAQYHGKPPVTVRLVDWADEEGARFGKSLFGSSACSGNLDMNEARGLVDKSGIKLPDALREVGIDFERVKDSGKELKHAAAYLELHIEQGPVLLDLDLPLGAVLGTFGVERHAITFHGQAAHSGSTPMNRRKDAFLAAAKLSPEIYRIAERSSGTSILPVSFDTDAQAGRPCHCGGVCTIGSCTTKPGIVTSVVEECRITLDQRHLDAPALAQMLKDARDASERFAAEGNVKVSWERLWQIAPRPFHDELIALCDESIRETCGQSHKLPSGPLHDAAEVARAGVPTVMMFVQSLHGISHNRIEDTKEEHLELCVIAFDKLAEKAMGWIRAKSLPVNEPVQIDQRLDDATVTDYCNEFLGFGHCKAPVWFIGIEEAGGWTVEDVQNRLRAWHEHGRKRLEDAPRFYPASGNAAWHGRNATPQATWKQLIRMLLLAQGQAVTDEAILDYQRNHFGAANGHTCLTELLPLPSPGAWDWNYNQWTTLPWLQSRDEYFQEFRGTRVNQLRQQIPEHKPKVVIFYGLVLPRQISLLPSWSAIAGGYFAQAFEDQQILLWRKNADTVFFVTRHPIAMGDEYFQQIGMFLRDKYGHLFRTVKTLSELNSLSRDEFVRVIGPVFEHSPWIAEATWPKRPFARVAELHLALCHTVANADEGKQLALIRAHPDLVGRTALAGTLTRESTQEQANAGLGDLTPEEIELFQRNNAAYQAKFGFPFVICARLNKKAAILDGFKIRLQNSREQEIQMAMAEILKIAELRLRDLTQD